jgi:prolyl-tRNA synthetase
MPADAEVASHQFMLRAGLIRRLAAGIYTWLPLGLRVLRKVETIIREEMDRAGAQELMMPFVQPAELWMESGRWEVMGVEMLRLNDRHDREFCLAPTHEEVITDLVRREVKSYKDLPKNFYQMNLKFRDEIRPRFGVMRGREFIMKDAYSFDLDDNAFQITYQKMHDAYSRILDRIGLNYRAVLADPGNIGGSNSHEFQVLAESGEDLIAFSTQSDYAANVERAEALLPDTNVDDGTAELERIATPAQHTITAVAEFLGVDETKTLKTLIVEGEDGPVALVLRGDHDLNEIKAQNLPGVTSPLQFADDKTIMNATGSKPGSIGPVGLKLPLFVDHCARATTDFVCGANEDGFHLTGGNWNRDVGLSGDRLADLRNVVDGDPSPDGSGMLAIKRGIEVGHIFQLGTKYSEVLNAQVQDSDGHTRTLIMGCYGMGVTRLVAAIIEQCHDDNGIVWPAAVAPYQVHVLGLNYTKSDTVKAAADDIYDQLQANGVDVLLDDRDERPGVKFADADLLGIPHRIVVGDRNLKSGKVEYRTRESAANLEVELDAVVDPITKTM